MSISYAVFCLNTVTTELSTLSLHDALPISAVIHTDLEPNLIQQITDALRSGGFGARLLSPTQPELLLLPTLKEYEVIVLDEWIGGRPAFERSEEHTSELQSHVNLVCRLLLEHGDHRALHSFPTRRSSDLCRDSHGPRAESDPANHGRTAVRWLWSQAPVPHSAGAPSTPHVEGI